MNTLDILSIVDADLILRESDRCRYSLLHEFLNRVDTKSFQYLLCVLLVIAEVSWDEIVGGLQRLADLATVEVVELLI